MLHSVLLYLEGTKQARPVIDCGVRLARRGEARVRGLTLLDTRRAEAAQTCEAAALLVGEQSRQTFALQRHAALRAELSQACLAAGVDFDIRRAAGDPLHVLPREARLHDLVITGRTEAKGSDSDIRPRDLVALVERGAGPLLVLPADGRKIERVLVPYDGSQEAGRAIRAYLGLGIFSAAQHRLLAVAPHEAAGRATLRELTDYFSGSDRPCESGIACGKPRRVLMPYAEKWQADLIVLGVRPAGPLLRPLLPNLTLEILNRLPCGVFAAS